MALIVNPASGVGRGARVADQVAARLRVSVEVDLRVGGSAAESADLVAAAVGACDAVAVVGGDGIVHLAAQALATTDTPLGIIAAGTGNDTAGSLGLPTDPIRASATLIEALLAESVRTIDLGRTDAGRWWVTVLCAGYDSAVNERANRMRWPAGPRRYDVAIVAELIRLRPRQLRCRLDGTVADGPVTLIAIGNAPQYGGGKLICPQAQLDDGRFAVTIVGPVTRRTLARLAPTLPRAGHLTHPAVTTHEARTVSLGADATVAYADGERLGPLPLTTTCIPRALRVLVPPGT